MKGLILYMKPKRSNPFQTHSSLTLCYSSVGRAFDFDAKISEIKSLLDIINNIRFSNENISEMPHLKCAFSDNPYGCYSGLTDIKSIFVSKGPYKLIFIAPSIVIMK